MFSELIEKLTRHEDLTAEEATAAMGEVMEVFEDIAEERMGSAYGEGQEKCF